MIGLPTGTSIWIAAGFTDLRRGFTGLSGMVQTTLQENPFSGHVFVFRGRRGDLIKMLWWDGDGLCLFAKRLERGRFIWPQATLASTAVFSARVTKIDPSSGFWAETAPSPTIRNVPWWMRSPPASPTETAART